MTRRDAATIEHYHIAREHGELSEQPYRTAAAARGEMSIAGNQIADYRVVKIRAGGNCPCQSSGDTGKKGESRTGRRHTRRIAAAAPQDSTAPEPRRAERKRHTHQASPPSVPMQPRLGAPETEPGANQITPQQECAHLNFQSGGGIEG